MKQFSLLLLLDIIVVFFCYIEADTTTQQRQLRGKYFCKVHFLRARSKNKVDIFVVRQQSLESQKKKIF